MFVLSAPSKIINTEANYINTLFSLLLKDENFSFINKSRVNVMISNQYEKAVDIRGIDDSVCNIKLHQPDYESYINLSYEERKRWQIETAYIALKELFIVKQWNVTYLDKLKSNILNNIHSIAIPMLKKEKKNKHYFVMVTLIPDIDKNTFCATFSDSKHEIWKVNFFEGYPLFLYWKRFFSSFDWIGDNVFKITDAKKEFSFVFDVSLQQYSINIESSSKDEFDILKFIDSWRCTSKTPMFEGV